MKKVLLLAVICSVCIAFSLKDTSVLKILVLNKLSEYTEKNYPEKIYIQTDKPYYIAGENIWFNTYLVNGITHKRTAKSKVIYVELINERDSIISERKLFTKSISVEGDFKLPTDLKDGKYLLRAYTNYMRNDPNDFFFKKEIQIFSLYSEANLSNGENPQSAENLELPDIGFYPEGGYLINGLSNKVAVRVKDADLSTNPIVGIIEDNLGNKVADFKTLEFGLASFFLKPEPGKEYHAVISSGNEDILYPLPTPLIEGYVMNTSITENEVLININTNKKDGLNNTFVIGHQRGLAVFDYTHSKNTQSMKLKISKDDLTEGVLDIVLFNESVKPVAERLVFIKNEENITVLVKKTNTSTLRTRERVNLEIEVKDNDGKLIPSTLSLSVTDRELINPDANAENIKTWLLLNSDLRGKIQSPNYFFQTGDNVKKNELLDLIMMTHGWRRFVWQDFLLQDILPIYKAEDGIYIEGNTVSTVYPYRNKASETKLTFRKNGFYQEEQKTDDRGNFSYGPFEFKDTITAFIQAGDLTTTEEPNFKDTNIFLYRYPYEKPVIIPGLAPQAFKEPDLVAQEAYIEKSKNIIISNFKFDKDREVLEEVLIKGKVKTKEEIKNIERIKRARTSSPSHRVFVDELGQHGSGDFMELISGIPGIRIEKDASKNGGGYDYIILFHGRIPFFYVDNIKVDLIDARAVSQSNIDFIDVIRAGSNSNDYALAAGGVIAIYTKRGSRDREDSIEKKTGTINFKLAGFYTAREFYAPDYSSSNNEEVRREDKRTTLYWQPQIFTNGYENANVSFYTSDEKGRFQIEVEGMTDAGMPIHTTAILEVE